MCVYIYIYIYIYIHTYIYIYLSLSLYIYIERERDGHINTPLSAAVAVPAAQGRWRAHLPRRSEISEKKSNRSTLIEFYIKALNLIYISYKLRRAEKPRVARQKWKLLVWRAYFKRKLRGCASPGSFRRRPAGEEKSPTPATGSKRAGGAP